MCSNQRKVRLRGLRYTQTDKAFLFGVKRETDCRKRQFLSLRFHLYLYDRGYFRVYIVLATVSPTNPQHPQRILNS